MMAIKRDTYKGMVVSKYNKKTMIQLKNLRDVPEILTKAMRSGYDVSGRKSFDRLIQIGRGILLCMMTEKIVGKKKTRDAYNERIP